MELDFFMIVGKIDEVMMLRSEADVETLNGERQGHGIKEGASLICIRGTVSGTLQVIQWRILSWKSANNKKNPIFLEKSWIFLVIKLKFILCTNWIEIKWSIKKIQKIFYNFNGIFSYENRFSNLMYEMLMPEIILPWKFNWTYWMNLQFIIKKLCTSELGSTINWRYLGQLEISADFLDLEGWFFWLIDGKFGGF